MVAGFQWLVSAREPYVVSLHRRWFVAHFNTCVCLQGLSELCDVCAPQGFW